MDSEQKKLIKKQIVKLEKNEAKLVHKKAPKFIREKVMPLQEKLESKIPAKLEETLEKAFIAGFKTVFKHGTGIIEKSYDKVEKQGTFNLNDYAVKTQTNKKNIKRLDQEAQKSMRMNQVVSTVEGGVLGALGIGLPDIPLFIGMMLKNIYEVSLAYGFDYNTKKEQIYILYLICASVTKEETKANYSKLLNEVVSEKTQIPIEDYRLDVIIKETAHQLADAMLIAKFVQGLPLVGVLGGAYNFTIMKDINKLAQVKYKQRYLEKLIH